MKSKKLIDHQTVSSVTNEIANTILGENKSYGSQCFGVSSLAFIAMKEGGNSKQYFADFLSLMKSLYYLRLKGVNKNLNYIELINKLCAGEIEESNEFLQQIRLIDPPFKLLIKIPILCVFNYIYHSIELIDGLFELVGDQNPLVQDFIKTREVLEKIIQDNELIRKVETLFPHYSSITGRSFIDDFKDAQQNLWGAKQSDLKEEAVGLFSVGVYTVEELQTYLKCIQQALDTCIEIPNTRVQFLSYTPSHALSFGYDTDEKTWYIVDSLNLTEENVIRGVPTPDAASRICRYFSNEVCAGFTSLIYADKKLHDLLKAHLSQDDAWKKIHDLDRPELLELAKKEFCLRTMIDFVVDTNDVNEIQRVIDSKYFIAFSNHNPQSFIELLTYAIRKNSYELVHSMMAKISLSKESSEFISEVLYIKDVLYYFISNGHKLLKTAITNGNIDVLRVLLLSGVSIAECDKEDVCALVSSDPILSTIIKINSVYRELILYMKSLDPSEKLLANTLRFMPSPVLSGQSKMEVFTAVVDIINAIKDKRSIDSQYSDALRELHPIMDKLPSEIKTQINWSSGGLENAH